MDVPSIEHKTRVARENRVRKVNIGLRELAYAFQYIDFFVRVDFFSEPCPSLYLYLHAVRALGTI